MSDNPQKKRLIFEFTDYCDEPFNDTDLKHFQDEMEDMLADYDLEITGVKVENVNEP
jgi:hypothetical protein